MVTLKAIKARGIRQLGRVDVALGPKSLIVIGPNGSGKSTLLGELAKELDAELAGREHPGRSIEESGGSGRDLRIAHLGRPVRMTWEGDPVGEFRSGRLIALAIDDDRSAPRATGVLDSLPKPPNARIAGQLEALLIDRWTTKQAASDPMHAQVLDAWLFGVRQTLRSILGEPKLRLAIQPESCAIDLGDGRRPSFAELSQGHRAALSLWAEVFLRVEAARSQTENPSLDPSGVVIVDHFERDLDPRLQRELLPLLARCFPGVQWIVSTHSALVALAHDDAIVFDAGRDEQRSTTELREEGLERLVARMIGMAPRPRSSRPPPPQRPPPGKLPRQRRTTKGGPGRWPDGDR